MTDNSQEMLEGIARRDLKRGLRLSHSVLSEEEIRDLVDNFFQNTE